MSSVAFTVAFTVVGSLSTSGCETTPTVDLRWRIAERDALPGDQAPLLAARKQCSGVGIERVEFEFRIAESDGPTGIVTTRQFRCFPYAFEDLDGTVAVGGLEDGLYDLEVRGLGRDGAPWPCSTDEDGELSCSTARTSLSNVALVDGSSLEVSLTPPRECEDGVDNDGDGEVDGFDLACRNDELASEDSESALSVFQVRASFLDANPNVLCSGLGIGSVRLRIVDSLDAVVEERLATCKSGQPFVDFGVVTLPLAADAYELRIVALSGTALERTTEKAIPFTIGTTAGAFLNEEIDFAASDFVDPIIAPPTFTSLYAAAPGVTRLCDPIPSLGGTLTLDELWFVVRDEQGTPVDPASFDGALLTPEGEGAVYECPNSKISGPALPWGAFEYEAQGRAGGVTCFTTDAPVQLAPRAGAESVIVELTRVVDGDGVPPPGCQDCANPGDCVSSASCVNNICVPNAQ